jgi:Tfp pilus assembly protein PilO
MSAREKALLAGCALFVAGFVAAKWLVLPAHAEYLRNRAAIPQRLATIARYESLRQGQDRIDEELFLQLQQLEQLEEGLLEGETTAVAGIYLQGLLKPLTQRPDTRVTSIRALPPVRKGSYIEVAVQMEVQTSTEGLALLLADIAGQPKILRVRKLTANGGGFYGSVVQRKEVIALSMVVAGLSAASFEEKIPGSGVEE